MKFCKIILLIIMFSSSAVVFAQQNTVAGSYTKKGSEFAVLGEFKKEDFLTSKKFFFKQTGSNDFEVLDIKNVSEILIGDEYKFVNKYTEYDVSNREPINFIKEPTLKREWILLNVVSESKDGATLYSYYDNESTRFFVNVAGSNNSELYLINKNYYSEVNKISTNKAFRNQLYAELKSQPSTIGDFENLRYSTEPIKNLITKYNTSNNYGQKDYKNSLAGAAKIKFAIFGGANLTSFNIEDGEFNTEADKNVQPSVGVEIALELASEKVDIFVRVEYERYSGASSLSRKNSDASPFATTHIFTFESNMFNVSAGPRWYFYKNNKSKVFAELGGGLSFPTDAVTYERISGSASVFTQIETNAALLLNFSLGYQFDKKWGIDVRYDFPRNYFTNTNITSTTKYSRLGLNLKYTLN